MRGRSGRGIGNAVGWLACAALATACATPTLQDQRVATREFSPGARRAPGPPRRVLLLTVAGLESMDFLDPWGQAAAEGAGVRMPNLARLAREGAMGIAARPPTPGSSFASHATIATGRLPRSHGVVADSAIEADGTDAIPFLDNRLLRGSALWDAAIGRGVIALGWPTTAGARIELLVPAVASSGGGDWLDRVRLQASPMLAQRLETIADADIEGESAAKSKRRGNLARTRATWPTPAEKDAAFVELACGIAASERDPGLWLLHFDQSGAAQRLAGYGSVEVAEALRRIDDGIGRLLGCLDEAGRLADTAVFVVGDVAYAPAHTRISPNVALVRTGLIGRDPRSATGVRSWLALVRSHGRSAYVYARDAAHALEARKLLETEAERTGAFEIVTAKELARLGADPQAWFGLRARPGYVLGNELVGSPSHPSEVRGAAGGLPGADDAGIAVPATRVGFVAWGRGIRNQLRLPRLELADVAPTIATLLGLRLDDDVAGEPLHGILRAAVAPPPPGPKRLDAGESGDVNETLRRLKRERERRRD